MKIEALHDFKNTEYAQQWAQQFTPTPERMRLFQTIAQNLPDGSSKDITVLELGVGPGFLADYLLSAKTISQYGALDFAPAMLELSRQRTIEHQVDLHFIQADLINESWKPKIPFTPQAVVSTWTLHDLFADHNILKVYQECFDLLPAGGILLNGDFVQPIGVNVEYEGGRIHPQQHLDLLKQAGFAIVEMIAEFETNLKEPNTANNYCCFKAIK